MLNHVTAAIFNQVANKPLLIHPSGLNTLYANFENSAALNKQKIEAGPVDDAARDGYNIQKFHNLAILTTRGVVIKNCPYWLADWGYMGLNQTERAIKSALMDDEVSEIIWVMDSPGGSVEGLMDFGEFVAKASKQKPITVLVDGMMASAAVWMTAGVSKIYSNRRDMIGSIGARMQLFDYSQYFEKQGIKSVVFDTGEYKSAGAMGEPLTDNHKKEFQRLVDGHFSDFKTMVVGNRPINNENFDKLADGRIFFANEEPLHYGLIDGIQSLQATIDYIFDAENKRKTAMARFKMLDF